MSKERRTIYRYSESFKEHVIQEVSQGSSISNGCKKKFWTGVIARCSSVKNKKIADMCKYFQYSRQAYYKSLRKQLKDCYSGRIIFDMVQRERHLQPRLGGKKLYFMLGSSIHEIDSHFGWDKFFNFLRAHNLLVKRKQKYCKTTHSRHHFHRYNNEIKDLFITRYNQVWAADITYLRTENGILKNEYLLDRTFKDFVHAGKQCASKNNCFNLEKNVQNIGTVEVKTIVFLM